MFIVQSLPLAILFCVITMLGWGSWANTQKLAGRERWPFELYYWDYAFGVLLCAVLFAATLGSFGKHGVAALENLSNVSAPAALTALASGAIFNVSNILLVVAIDAAGMSVAFPVGVGLALVIGTVASYRQAPKGNVLLLAAGVGMVVLAIILSAIAHRRVESGKTGRPGRGLLFALLAGSLMGLFYARLIAAISPGYQNGAIEPGYLTPYTALLLFGIGLLLSNVVVNTIFMRAGGVTYRDYAAGSARLHLLGILGGVIWMVALGLNVIASGAAGAAVSYALGQGATLVASIWGVFIWKEFRNAPQGTAALIAIMFCGYAAGLALIGAATL
jgi:glucose uptake protein